MKNVLLTSLLLLVSCSSTLDFHVPTQNFVTPEVVGKTLGGRVQGTYTNSMKFELARLEVSTIFDDSVEVSTQQGTTKDNVLNATGAIGFGNAFELTYRTYSDSPDLFGFKVQVIGRDDGTYKEGLKVSIFGGYGNAETDNDTITATELDGSNARSYDSTLDVESYEGGVVLGYRVNKNILPYVAYVLRTSNAEGTLNSSSLTPVTIKNKAKIKSAQLGLQLNNEKNYALLEAGYSKSEWGGLNAEEDYTLGAAIGHTFR